jgi:hypothetical protein
VKPSLNRLPSPALVIACVALFVSLGGVSYGLAKGSIDSREIKNNTIRSKDVRNNTLRTFDIRNNEVRGFDIRNSTVRGRDVAFDTLSGQDVSEATLAKVPSATTADTAASATTAGSAASATTAGSVATLKTIAPTSLTEGAAPMTLATHGPLTLTGACEAAGATTEAIARVQSTEGSSAAGGTSAVAAGATTVTNPSFGPATVAVGKIVDMAGAARTFGGIEVFAFAPSGKAITGQLGAIADAGANSCLFHGHVALEG